MTKSDIVRTNGRTLTAYTPYDPQFEIGEKEVPIIHQSSMKILGQEIFKDLSDKDTDLMWSPNWKIF